MKTGKGLTYSLTGSRLFGSFETPIQIAYGPTSQMPPSVPFI